ncbi:hypothetical protein [Rhodococcus sp. IEGM 1379]|uniref:hypothetical protein n=1 Tax=Rhodococcus sp. IEGM 1379 TaxID=3047086 RepID=UPI0024B728DA|nr:hypothetical protein [Rhodococcus sp. IEGM 1379]MDI9918799.1 hypothetical protein [Rhodococcus sp. IEGM 1379]
MTNNNEVHTGNKLFTGIDVAIVGVSASRSHRAATRTRSPWEAMEDYAAMICDRTALHAVRLPLATTDVNTVIARVLGLQPSISAAFVVGLDANAAEALQHGVAERGGPLVITEIDFLTTTLTAMTISTLRNLKVGPRVGQVVITGAHRAPMLGPALMLSGIAGISSWRRSDAHQFPLHRLMEHNDVLVDLDRCAGNLVTANRIVTLPHKSFGHGAVVIPGFLSVLCGHGVSVLTVEMIAACARSLALITPPGRTLPPPDSRMLLSSIARQVIKSLGHSPTART